MSFTKDNVKSTVYAPGWFLADPEHCVRKTYTIKSNSDDVKETENGGKYVPMGTVYKAKEGIAGAKVAIGFLYEDVDVTTGDMPGSIVRNGTVYEDRLPAKLGAPDKENLEAAGFKFITEPKVERPTKGED